MCSDFSLEFSGLGCSINCNGTLQTSRLTQPLTTFHKILNKEIDVEVHPYFKPKPFRSKCANNRWFNVEHHTSAQYITWLWNKLPQSSIYIVSSPVLNTRSKTVSSSCQFVVPSELFGREYKDWSTCWSGPLIVSRYKQFSLCIQKDIIILQKLHTDQFASNYVPGIFEHFSAKDDS